MEARTAHAASVPDHRDLNHDLEIFATDPLAGAGLPLWLPAGTVLRAELERLAADLARADGCTEVRTPVLGKRALFERSGHWDKFRDDMFPPMRVGGDELVLRPATCPHHALVYRATGRHSWRDLPLRLHELAPMFRSERSGVLSGLSRVRQIHLDDTHVFCRPDQAADEAARAVRSALRAQRVLGLRVDHVRLSRPGEVGVLGEADRWAEAEDALRAAAAAAGVEAVDGPGEAAFYGPKLDLQVRRGGHEETIATVQLDVVQPDRFDLTFDAADGSRPPVVMVHRGTVGSMERVAAALLEEHTGRLPLWLAPVQVCLLPVAPEHDGAARDAADRLRAAGLRVRVDHDGSLGARVRAARGRRDAVVGVLGDAEVASGSVHVSDVRADHHGPVRLGVLVSRLSAAYGARAAQVDWAGG
jgi:threonyl-tRNA synthetase